MHKYLELKKFQIIQKGWKMRFTTDRILRKPTLKQVYVLVG